MSVPKPNPIPCAGCRSPIYDISSACIQPHPLFPALKVLFCTGCLPLEPTLQRTDSGLSIKTPPNKDDCYNCGKSYLVEDREESTFCSATCEYLSRSQHSVRRGAPRPSAEPCDCGDYEDYGWCTMVEGLIAPYLPSDEGPIPVRATTRPPTPYPDDCSPLVLCQN